MPIVTLCGKSYTARMSSSLLNAIGLTELITYNLKDYKTLALKLAKDIEDAGAKSLGIKDMAGLLKPKTAYSLIYNFGVWPPFLWKPSRPGLLPIPAIKRNATDLEVLESVLILDEDQSMFFNRAIEENFSETMTSQPDSNSVQVDFGKLLEPSSQ